MPDWRGETAIVVASGPSAAEVDLWQAKGAARWIAINNSWQLCPWADLLFAGDFLWWKEHQGCPEFPGVKVSTAYAATREAGWNVRWIQRRGSRLVSDRRDRVGWNCSALAGLNIAVHARPRKLLLIGFDLRIDRGLHWHGAHGGSLNNPRQSNLGLWRDAIDAAASPIARLGIRAINCSPVSTLKNFPIMAFEEALAA